MRVTLSVRIEWDKAKETLPQMREKYEALKEHFERMQLTGTLPRGEIKWMLTTMPKHITPPPDDPSPGIPVRNVPYEPPQGGMTAAMVLRENPKVMHSGGNRLL